MKKRILSFFLVAIMSLGIAATALGADLSDIYPAVSQQTVMLDGSPVEIPMYLINGNNYAKLRDLAFLLNNTGASFSCVWSDALRTIFLTSGQVYTPIGGEMTALAESPVVNESNGSVYVDGEPATLSGYNLNNNNYYKLRDLSRELDFAVYWDYTQEIVVLDSYSTYEDAAALEEATKSESEQPPQDDKPADSSTSGYVLANGKEITDDNIREILNNLKSDYPEGMSWTNANTYLSTTYYNGVSFYGGGCAGFGLICSDAIWGSYPAHSRYSDFESIRVGDMLRVDNDTHTVMVMEVKSDSIVVCEGNYNDSIHWGREVTRASLLAGNFTGETRYPE